MNTLLVRFALKLYDTPVSDTEWEPHGAVFHRWLPDGENDAILLTTDAPNATVRIWIERRGKVDRRPARIIYDDSGRGVDQGVMRRQGALHAGILDGQIRITEVSDDDVARLRASLRHQTASDTEDQVEYVNLGKHVDRLIVSAVSPFIELLRYTYGQYWIRSIEKWDATKKSIGQHFMIYGGAKWSLDNGKTWHAFQPGPNVTHSTGTMPEKSMFKQYLTRDDWSDIASSVGRQLPQSFAAEMAHETQRLLDDGHHRFAVIQVITALEIALNAFFDARRTDNEVVRTKSQLLRSRGNETLSLDLRVCIATLNLDGIAPSDVESALLAIKTRNNAVHEGYQPTSTDLERIHGTLRVIAALLEQPRMRFLSRHIGQVMATQDVWDAVDE